MIGGDVAMSEGKRGREGDSRAGFTLMEVLVVLAIFSTISVAVADLFMLSSRAQRRTGDMERLQSESRYTLAFLEHMISSGEIAYDRMPSPIAEPSDTLSVRSASAGVDTISLSSDSAGCGRAATPCLLLENTDLGGALVSMPLTPAGYSVRDLKFFVNPGIDPFSFDPSTGTYAADAQPIVTVVLSLEPVGQPGQAITVQTAVATRTYAR